MTSRSTAVQSPIRTTHLEPAGTAVIVDHLFVPYKRGQKATRRKRRKEDHRVNVNVADSLIQFEANAPVDHGDGVLRLFLVKDIHFDVTYDSNLRLNRGRQEKFNKK
ncbi:hypothetical protein HPB50_028939 [Hyalomma asiaticum]|nr:hypothetical protein HPB50_028939 [Hyalomma asiaticum]